MKLLEKSTHFSLEIITYRKRIAPSAMKLGMRAIGSLICTSMYETCRFISNTLLNKSQSTLKQGMLFSIVPRFGNTWFLLCLEWLDADWLNGCVCLEALHSDCFYCMWYLLCLEILHSDCFCCMWYCYHAFSLDECPSSPVGGRIFCCPCILIG